MKNRTELADLRRTNRCPPCAEVAAESDRRRRAQDAAERRRGDLERTATLRRARVGYLPAHPDMLDDTGGAGFCLDIPVPEWGVSTVRLADFNAIRREVAAARLSPQLDATD